MRSSPHAHAARDERVRVRDRLTTRWNRLPKRRSGRTAGIGRAVAVLFAREGANVAITYLPQEQLDADETKEAVEREQGQCLLLPVDIRTSQACRDLVSRTAQQYGPIDILVNNAGRQTYHERLEDITDDDLDATFKVIP